MTRPHDTTGEATPCSSGTCHSTLTVSGSVWGTATPAGTCPSRAGPRHCGQSSAARVKPANIRRRVQIERARIMNGTSLVLRATVNRIGIENPSSPSRNLSPRRMLLQIRLRFLDRQNRVGGRKHRLILHPLLDSLPVPIGLLLAGQPLDQLHPPVVLHAPGVGDDRLPVRTQCPSQRVIVVVQPVVPALGVGGVAEFNSGVFVQRPVL